MHPELQQVLKNATGLSPALTTAAVATLGQELTEMDIDGSTWLLMAVPVSGTNWKRVISLHKGEALASMTSFLMRFVVGTLIATLLSALLATLVVSRSIRGLGRLQTATEDVASDDGDLSKRLDTQGHDLSSHTGAATAHREQTSASMEAITNSPHRINDIIS